VPSVQLIQSRAALGARTQTALGVTWAPVSGGRSSSARSGSSTASLS